MFLGSGAVSHSGVGRILRVGRMWTTVRVRAYPACHRSDVCNWRLSIRHLSKQRLSILDVSQPRKHSYAPCGRAGTQRAFLGFLFVYSDRCIGREAPDIMESRICRNRYFLHHNSEQPGSLNLLSLCLAVRIEPTRGYARHGRMSQYLPAAPIRYKCHETCMRMASFECFLPPHPPHVCPFCGTGPRPIVDHWLISPPAGEIAFARLRAGASNACSSPSARAE